PIRQTLRVERAQSCAPSSLYSRPIRASDRGTPATIEGRYSKWHALALHVTKTHAELRESPGFVSIATVAGQLPVLEHRCRAVGLRFSRPLTGAAGLG